MRVLPFFCLLLGYCLAAPSDPQRVTTAHVLVINDKFIKNDQVIYTGQHDIVRIFAPFNQFPFKKSDLLADWWQFNDKTDSSSSEEEAPCAKYTVFFVEADVKDDEKAYKGLYVQKNGKVTKLLDNGRDAVENNENVIYFGASDGIYKYNEAANTAEKHGTVTDNIIQLEFNNDTNSIYYLTANHELFKLNTEATSSVKLSGAKDVKKFVFGYDGKMYYYDSKKDVYVFDEVNDKSVKISDLPANVDHIALISPVVGMVRGAILVVDKAVYFIKPDGTYRRSQLGIDLEATAYEPKPTLIQFLAKDKKLYELDIIAIMKSYVDKLPEDMKHMVALFPAPKNCKKTVE